MTPQEQAEQLTKAMQSALSTLSPNAQCGIVAKGEHCPGCAFERVEAIAYLQRGLTPPGRDAGGGHES